MPEPSELAEALADRELLAKELERLILDCRRHAGERARKKLVSYLHEYGNDIVAALRASGAGAEMRNSDRLAEIAARELLISEQTKACCAEVCRFMGGQLYDTVKVAGVGHPEVREKIASAARTAAQLCAEGIEKSVKATPAGLQAASPPREPGKGGGS